jgi:hypothetical protein
MSYSECLRSYMPAKDFATLSLYAAALSNCCPKDLLTSHSKIQTLYPPLHVILVVYWSMLQLLSSDQATSVHSVVLETEESTSGLERRNMIASGHELRAKVLGCGNLRLIR